MRTAVADALRAALETGEFIPLGRHYATGGVLDVHLPGPRRSAEATCAELLWPLVAATGGAVHRWELVPADGGFEVDVMLATTRQAHVVHLDGAGRVVRHLVYPAAVPDPDPPPLPDAVAALVADGGGTPVGGGWSGAQLFRVRGRDGRPLVVKHVRPGVDWMARASRDRGREALLFRAGVFDRLPARLRAPVLAAEPTADGWLLVMRDITDAHRAFADAAGDPAQLAATLRHLASLHQAGQTEPPVELLCTLADRLALFGPARPLAERHGVDTLPKTFTLMWEVFADRVEPSLAEPVLRLAAAPEPLLSALAKESHALLHGDFQPSNLGAERDPTVAFDWGLSGFGPGELDYVWFLSNTAWDGDDQRDYLERVWTEATGTPRHARVSALAVIFHAVMGEVAFLVAEGELRPTGLPRPSLSTMDWWTARLRSAFERVGDVR